MSGVLNPEAFSDLAAKLISEAFNVLSVSIWRLDEQEKRLICTASTAQLARNSLGEHLSITLEGSGPSKTQTTMPFSLEEPEGNWAELLRNASASHFRAGGNRICVPLLAGERWLGYAILADRVNGRPYTIEEFELLKCIADQVAATLQNLRLTDELMQAKELEAFQTMSAFFVHDLKNATSTLS